MLEYWNNGIRDGMLEYWNDGVMEYWNIKLIEGEGIT
jgi:hypothetical protein